jgi:hypothetical protein
MLSKSTAAILLFLALVVAAFGGGYLALRTFGASRDPISDDELRKLKVEVDALDPAPGKTEQAAMGAPGPGASAGAAPGSGGAPAGSAPGGGAAKPPPIPRIPAPPQPVPAPAIDPPAIAAAPAVERGAPPPPAPEVARKYEEVMIEAGEIIDLQLRAPLSTETAKVEDAVEARIIKDVKGGNYLAIPAGTKMMGSVSVAEKGNAIKNAARLGVIFHTIVMRNGDEVPVAIDELMQVGPSPAGDSKAKIGGGAAAGAALGWLKGGLSGAIRGGAIGGGAGTGLKVVEGRKPAELPAGAQARVELRAPIFVMILK